MGRHSSTPVREEPAREKRRLRQTLADTARRVWQRLVPEEFRRRMYHRRQAWRGWWDRLYMPKGAWDAQLPKDPANWSDSWDHIGSYAVAAELRRLRAERGDLLPQRPRIEPLQEES